jgi:FG-GAP-like repeat
MFSKRGASFLVVLPILLLAQLGLSQSGPRATQGVSRPQTPVSALPLAQPFSTLPQSRSAALGSSRSQLGSLPPPAQRLLPPGLNLNSFRLSHHMHHRSKFRPMLLGSASSIFLEATSYDPRGEGTDSIAIGDVNGDGKLDLVVTNGCADSNCTNGSVSVLLGNGDGTFRPAVTYSSGGQEALSVAIGDVNGDGRLDIIVANANGELCLICR